MTSVSVNVQAPRSNPPNPSDEPVVSTASTPAAAIAQPGVQNDPWAKFGPPPQLQSFNVDKNGPGGGAKSAKGANAVGATNAPPSPKTAAPVYDIAKTTSADIERLRKEGKERLANTIANAQVAYGDLLETHPRVKIVVTTSDGNGGQPVLVVRGPDYQKGAHVHTHYHGDNATVADDLGSKAGTNARIRAVILKEDPQAVFVLPEAQNSTEKGDSFSNDNTYSASWGNVESQVQTTADALEAAGVTDKPTESVVSFHSGGGMALVNLVNADKTGSRLKADRIELYDCVYHFGKDNIPLYHFEARLRDWSKTDNGKAVDQVIYYRGSNDASRTQVIEQSFPAKDGKARFALLDMKKEPAIVEKDGKIDEKLDPVAEDTRGNAFEVTRNGKQTGKIAHNFNPDSHYRTTGQFLGSKPRP